jgi:hypothetical protein
MTPDEAPQGGFFVATLGFEAELRRDSQAETELDARESVADVRRPERWI